MKTIIYPEPLKKGSVIAITGPSGGVHERFNNRFELAVNHLKSKGFEVVEGNCLRGEHKHVSGPKEKRAQDFMELWMNDNIDAIIPPWGGELLIEILPLLDFEKMKTAKPKWVMGYSDISTLLFPLTLKTGISSVHGTNLLEMIPSQKDSLTINCLELLNKSKGDSYKQNSSDKFQVKGPSFTDEYEKGFNLEHKTQWKVLNSNSDMSISGHIIGGCLDTISTLVGTPYGDLSKFKEMFENNVILYFENCEASPCDVARKLWTMKFAGWFDDIAGIMFGRSSGKDTDNERFLSYVEVLQTFFSELDIPVIYDADIGHQQPNMTILNGSFVEVSVEADGKGCMVTHLK